MVLSQRKILVGVEGDARTMHVFEVADLVPGREARWEGPSFYGEADVVKERDAKVIWTPEGAWEGHWIIRWSGWGSGDLSDDGRRRGIAARGER